MFFSLFTTFFCKSTMKIFSACIAGGNGRVKVGVLLQSSVGAVTLSEDMFLLPFCCFLSEIVCFFVIFTHLYTQFFFFCRFLSCFSNAFSSVLFLYLFMNHSLLLFFRVLQNVFACIFFLLQLCFYNCNICVTFPLLLQKDFWLIFQPHFHRKLLTFCLFATFR